MIIGCCFCVFAVLINKVSLQETVHREAVIGGSVDLRCSSTEHDLKPQDTNVHWRHNGSEIVYDIVNGKDSLELQDPRYKYRAETFPDEYLKGNFSIKLKNLTRTDSGEFSCFTSYSDEPQTIQLIIKESTAENEMKSNEREKQPDNKEDSVETSSYWIAIVVVGVASVILLFSFGFYFSKKKQASSFSSVRT